MVLEATTQPAAAVHEDGLGGAIHVLEPGDQQAPMRFRMVLPPGMGPPAAECHPSQVEDFHVLRGRLDLGKVGGKRVVLGPGERFTLPAGVHHLPACDGDQEVEFEAVLTPGLDSAAMFEALYRATREHRGLGQVLRIAVVMTRYRHTIRLAQPFGLMMRGLAGVARVLGVGDDLWHPRP